MTSVQKHTRVSRPEKGITLIELMIIVASIAIIFTVALPVYKSYTIRAKLDESLSVAVAAKTAVAKICIGDPTIDPLTNRKAGYAFVAFRYVRSISLSGSCATPLITLHTQVTGVNPAIILLLKGSLNDSRSGIDWICTSNTSNRNLPVECRA